MMMCSVLVLAVFLLSLVMTRLLMWYSSRRTLVDHYNERSSHVVPTPCISSQLIDMHNDYIVFYLNYAYGIILNG